jgi:hypothetical protein
MAVNLESETTASGWQRCASFEPASFRRGGAAITFAEPTPVASMVLLKISSATGDRPDLSDSSSIRSSWAIFGAAQPARAVPLDRRPDERLRFILVTAGQSRS